jgi:hypothetical protein
VVFGLTGRFWQADYGQVSLQNSEDFLSFNAHGAARLALNFSVECLANSRTRLATETRVFCLDAEAKRKFTPYWYLIRPVSGLIRQKMLATIGRNGPQFRNPTLQSLFHNQHETPKAAQHPERDLYSRNRRNTPPLLISHKLMCVSVRNHGAVDHIGCNAD